MLIKIEKGRVKALYGHHVIGSNKYSGLKSISNVLFSWHESPHDFFSQLLLIVKKCFSSVDDASRGGDDTI
jgi:hypothetical protein